MKTDCETDGSFYSSSHNRNSIFPTLRVYADVVAASVIVGALVHVLARQPSVCLGEAQVADALMQTYCR